MKGADWTVRQQFKFNAGAMQAASTPELQFDFVIVGAGSAGCVLANRLSADASVRVALLEAGAADNSIWMRIPLGVGKLLGDERCMWQADTEPEAELHGNRLYWPSGKVLGGSSSVNGMLFVRGHPHRYDAWRDAGCPGWGYDDFLPYFRKLEDCGFGDPHERGRGGPIAVTEVPGDPLTDGFVEACVQAGARRAIDYNVGEPDGAAPLQLATRDGVRCSAATAYLKPARSRPNLTVISGALATRILFEGTRARGVEFMSGDRTTTVRATREVLMCAGAIRSPQLLELSGVGDATVLGELGIGVIAHLPGVGENLQDHLMPRIAFECNTHETINDMLGSPWRMGKALARYALSRKGLFATPSLTALAYMRSRPEAEHTDIRIQIGHVSSTSRFAVSRATGIDPHSGFHLGGYFIFPRSRGRLHVRSRNAAEPPRIEPRYLSHADDRDGIVRTLRILRRVSAQPALARFIVREVRPGADVASDDELLDYARSTGQTCWHPAGTCAMGVQPNSVVDPQLRVRGTAGLRVVDASVMPLLVSSNTNVPTIAIAEKAADLILADVHGAP